MAKKKRGPGKYREWLTQEGLLKLEGWARDGLTDEQIARNIGIVPSTLYEWKKKHSEISEALKKGKEVIDRQVENALLKRALGYSYEEITYERIENTVVEPDGTIHVEPGTKIKTVVKQVVPDTTAQIFWLKNRKPEQWRDKQDIDVKGDMELNNPFKGLTTEELKKLIDE